jgi:hypothetical protein
MRRQTMITINTVDVRTIRARKRLAVMLETIMLQLNAVSCRENMQEDEFRDTAVIVAPPVTSILQYLSLS